MSGKPVITFVRVRTDEQIELVGRLAHGIWYEYYVPLIGRAQVDYMVPKFQSAAAIREQIASDYEYYMMLSDGQEAGYLAVQPQPAERRMFVSKLYLVTSARGSGTGRVAMEFIEDMARKRGLATLWLTVNKGNPAAKAYERLGFRNVEAIVMDIGNGFVMDDFRMEKGLN